MQYISTSNLLYKLPLRIAYIFIYLSVHQQPVNPQLLIFCLVSLYHCFNSHIMFGKSIVMTLNFFRKQIDIFTKTDCYFCKNRLLFLQQLGCYFCRNRYYFCKNSFFFCKNNHFISIFAKAYMQKCYHPKLLGIQSLQHLYVMNVNQIFGSED